MNHQDDHLSQDQFASCIVGRPTGAEREHIAECSECAAELERVGSALSLFRSAVRGRVDDRVARPAVGVAPSSVRRIEADAVAWRWGVVAAAALVLVMLPFLGREHAPQEIRETVSAAANADAVMDAVNLHLSRTVPAPMEPMLSLMPVADSAGSRSNDVSITKSGGVQ